MLPNGRCRRPGCRQLFAEAERVARSTAVISARWGLRLGLDMPVTCRNTGASGRIVGFEGPDVKVLLDGQQRPQVHPALAFNYPPGETT